MSRAASLRETLLHWHRLPNKLPQMIALHPQYVTDADGHRIAVQLSAEEYDKLLEELEELEDIAAYQAAKAAGGEAVPYEQVRRELGLAE